MSYIFIIAALAAGAIITLVVFILARPKKDDQGMQVLNQRLDLLNTSMNQALRDTVKMVSEQLKESRESVERSSSNVHRQVEGFTSGLTKLSESVKNVHEQIKGVASFQDIFKSPKLRGIWGEASLEASLAQYFPKDRYQLQYYFKSGEVSGPVGSGHQTTVPYRAFKTTDGWITVAAGQDQFSLLSNTFPAGTLTGAPKIRAMEIIEDLEKARRGPYGGTVGYFSLTGDMDTCITIRTMIVKGRTAYLQAGAGIVADSDPQSEWAETCAKMEVLKRAIALAEEGL